MATIQTVGAVAVLALGVVLFTTPAWADLGSRSGVPPIQSHQPVTLHEDQRHGAQSTPTHRGGLPADSLWNLPGLFMYRLPVIGMSLASATRRITVDWATRISVSPP